jgi:hypothetical protein
VNPTGETLKIYSRVNGGYLPVAELQAGNAEKAWIFAEFFSVGLEDLESRT